MIMAVDIIYINQSILLLKCSTPEGARTQRGPMSHYTPYIHQYHIQRNTKVNILISNRFRPREHYNLKRAFHIRLIQHSMFLFEHATVRILAVCFLTSDPLYKRDYSTIH